MKVLLISDVPPCKDYSGGLLTDSLCRYLDQDSISCFIVKDKKLKRLELSNDLDIEIVYEKKPKEANVSMFRNMKRVNTLAGILYEYYSEFYLCKKLTRKIKKTISDKEIDRVWCILQGQTMIRIAYLLSRQSKMPIMIQVWDHVDWWIGNNKINKISSLRIKRKYDYLVSHCTAFGGASFEMAERNKKDGVFSVPLIASLPRTVIQNEIKSLKHSTEIVIGFSGQFYASDAFNMLLGALEKKNWTILNKKVRVRILGYNLSISGHRRYNLEFLGYRSQNEVLRLLNECDLLYCPYITDRKYKIVAETSFPSKLTTYLSTAVPVLFYGPSYSAPSKFLNKYDAAYLVYSDKNNNVNEFDSMLESIFSDTIKYTKISKNSKNVVSKFLTNEQQEQYFKLFISAGGKLSL